jgi:flagellar assembly protein FliH
LSKLIKNGNPPLFNIGSYEADFVKQDRSTPKSKNTDYHGGLPLGEDPSVSAWNLPVVEKVREDQDSEEGLKARLAKLEKEAYEKGFEQGQRDGLALEKKKMDEMGRQIEALCAGLRDLKPQIYSESEGELLKLSLLMAKKLLGEEIRTNSGIIGNTIRSCLKFLVDKRKVRIVMNPDDMDEARKILPDLAKLTKGGHFELTGDNSIERGGCILETGFGKINATIDDQMSMLEEVIEQQYQSFRKEAGASLS